MIINIYVKCNACQKDDYKEKTEFELELQYNRSGCGCCPGSETPSLEWTCKFCGKEHVEY